jgi:short-subunit dehydrogenase
MVAFNQKPINEQVIVITGASSGIGLATATLAARRGARVVLSARNGNDLARAVEDIRADGGRAIYQPADVSDPGQMFLLADAAIAEFGAIDTWINNAGVAVYGRLMDTPIVDMRRQFEVNYWGVVHGSRAAVPHLRKSGGTLINVASALADRAIPLQGNYCASKHAVKAFTDSLRVELEEEGSPVSVTLVKPSSMDTPLFQKARTMMDVEPQPIPPVYDPEVAARAILECAEQPKRDVFVGATGKLLAMGEKASSRRTDRYVRRKMFAAQETDVPVSPDRDDNLYEHTDIDGGVYGRNWQGRTRGTSLYTWSSLNRGRAAMLAGTLGVVAALGAKVFGNGTRTGRLLRK